MTEKHKSAGGEQGQHAKLDRTVDRACPRCMAPGKFTSDVLCRDGYSDAQVAESIAALPANMPAQQQIDFATQLRAGWPGCYVKPGDVRDGLPMRDVIARAKLGAKGYEPFKDLKDVCPNCGYDRPEGERQPQLEIEGRL